MILNIAERVGIQDILQSAHGDITAVKIMRDLSDALSFSEEEIAKSGLSVEENQVRWDKDIQKDIEIGPKAMSIIRAEFKRLNEAGALTLAHLTMYEKFVEGA